MPSNDKHSGKLYLESTGLHVEQLDGLNEVKVRRRQEL